MTQFIAILTNSMSINVWGNLAKAQDDPEKIEEAIARIIEEHNDDPEAHLGEDQSLQSHKASEIIDHLAHSIISDKIKEKEVKLLLLDFDRQLFMPTFESLDGWEQIKVGSGSDVQIRGFSCKLITGNSVGNNTAIYLETMIGSVTFDKNPFFQAYISSDADSSAQDVAVGVGDFDPWGPRDFFGFRWDKAAGKSYAYVLVNGVEYKEEISAMSDGLVGLLRAELLDDGETIKFYRNGFLIKTFSDVGLYIDSDTYFCFSNVCRSAGNNAEAKIRDVVFSQSF